MAWTNLPDLAKGLNLDASPEEVAPGTATGGSNMRFRSGFAERARGIVEVYNAPTVTPYSLCAYTVGSTRFMIHTGTQKTFVDDGTTQTEITNANNTGSQDDRWTPIVFNGVYLQNNGVDVPQYWDGNVANNLVDVPGWPSGYTARASAAFKNFLVFGDITRASVRERATVFWSDISDPGSLPGSFDISDPTTSAGDVPLAETNGTIIDFCALGDTLVVYKDDSLFGMQYIGGNDIFRTFRFQGNTGLLARGCVVQTPKGHVFLTTGYDVALFTGQGEPTSLAEGRMRTRLSTDINQDYANRAFLVTHPATNEVLICYPSGASQVCNKALVWSWENDTFWERDLPNVTCGAVGQVSVTADESWDSDSDPWDTDTTVWASAFAPNSLRLVLGTNAPKLGMFDVTDLDFADTFSASVEYTSLAFDAPEVKKLCRGVRPRIAAPAGTVVTVQVGGGDLGQSPTWSDPVTFTVGTDTKVDSFASGYGLALRFTGSDYFRVRGAQMDILPQGKF